MSKSTSGETFTIEELLGELIRKPGSRVEGAYTARELHDAMRDRGDRKSLNRIREELRERIRAGQMECIFVETERIDGTMAQVPAYRLVKRDEEQQAEE